MEEILGVELVRDGRIVSLSQSELKLALSKLYSHPLYVIKKLIKNRSFHSLFFIAKGLINKILQKKPSLELSEHISIWTNLLGFSPKMIKIVFKNFKIKMDSENYPFNVILADMDMLITKNQYCIGVENIKNKVVIDAGANDGIFAIYAAKLGARKVYAFEPLKQNYEILRKNIALNGLEKIIIPVNKAIGDKNEENEIKYTYRRDGAASIDVPHANKYLKYDKCQKIQIVKIDDFFEGKRIDFIKMDVEGYEKYALLGAQKTIKRYKPILSFSAYPKPVDKEHLPRIVKQIRKDYTCILHKNAEEIFYCE